MLTWRGDSKKQGTIDLERPFCCLLVLAYETAMKLVLGSDISTNCYIALKPLTIYKSLVS